MKIGHLDSTHSASPVAERKPAASTPAAGTAAEPSAKVELSQAGSLTSASGEGSFDSEKVDRIATAIREGKFTINAEAIADKLLQNAQDLMGRSSR